MKRNLITSWIAMLVTLLLLALMFIHCNVIGWNVLGQFVIVFIWIPLIAASNGVILFIRYCLSKKHIKSKLIGLYNILSLISSSLILLTFLLVLISEMLPKVENALYRFLDALYPLYPFALPVLSAMIVILWIAEIVTRLVLYFSRKCKSNAFLHA
ncbi:MAG: hypothetical protein IJW92_01445 [Clostridia bacterium]|nr:hypothetical protein [Clostridia bacterium]